MIQFDEYSYSHNDLTNRIDRIKTGQVANPDRKKALKKILEMVDLTTLNGDDTNAKVTELCVTALSFIDISTESNGVAAVCVYPVFAQLVHLQLLNSKIKTACVAGAFPSGLAPLEVKIHEVSYALEQGADEIDMVISRGKMIEGEFDFVFNEINQIKSICGDATLKVILETGELKTIELVRKASEIAILAGADFLKTSTGKISPAAEPITFLVMLDTIFEYYQKTGKKIGIKAAGGISETDDALIYYYLVESVLGKNWIDKNLFRIGASRLADKLFHEISGF